MTKVPPTSHTPEPQASRAKRQSKTTAQQAQTGQQTQQVQQPHQVQQQNQQAQSPYQYHNGYWFCPDGQGNYLWLDVENYCWRYYGNNGFFCALSQHCFPPDQNLWEQFNHHQQALAREADAQRERWHSAVSVSSGQAGYGDAYGNASAYGGASAYGTTAIVAATGTTSAASTANLGSGANLAQASGQNLTPEQYVYLQTKALVLNAPRRSPQAIDPAKSYVDIDSTGRIWLFDQVYPNHYTQLVLTAEGLLPKDSNPIPTYLRESQNQKHTSGFLKQAPVLADFVTGADLLNKLEPTKAIDDYLDYQQGQRQALQADVEKLEHQLKLIQQAKDEGKTLAQVVKANKEKSAQGKAGKDKRAQDQANKELKEQITKDQATKDQATKDQACVSNSDLLAYKELLADDLVSLEQVFSTDELVSLGFADQARQSAPDDNLTSPDAEVEELLLANSKQELAKRKRSAAELLAGNSLSGTTMTEVSEFSAEVVPSGQESAEAATKASNAQASSEAKTSSLPKRNSIYAAQVDDEDQAQDFSTGKSWATPEAQANAQAKANTAKNQANSHAATATKTQARAKNYDARLRRYQESLEKSRRELDNLDQLLAKKQAGDLNLKRLTPENSGVTMGDTKLGKLVEDFFTLAQKYTANLKDRPEQRQMAAAIADLFSESGGYFNYKRTYYSPVKSSLSKEFDLTDDPYTAKQLNTLTADLDTLLREAPTGTGKSIAYLVPAVLSGKPIIISTGFKNLQNQLLHDFPRLQKTLNDLHEYTKDSENPFPKVEFSYHIFKGQENYLCLRSFFAVVQGYNLAMMKHTGNFSLEAFGGDEGTEKGGFGQQGFGNAQGGFGQAANSLNQNGGFGQQGFGQQGGFGQGGGQAGFGQQGGFGQNGSKPANGSLPTGAQKSRDYLRVPQQNSDWYNHWVNNHKITIQKTAQHAIPIVDIEKNKRHISLGKNLLEAIYHWAAGHTNGFHQEDKGYPALDLEDLKLALNHMQLPQEVKELLFFNRAECTRTNCDFYRSCPFFSSRQKASESSVLVLNHKLLATQPGNPFIRYYKQGDTSTARTAVIIDEAHSFAHMIIDDLTIDKAGTLGLFDDLSTFLTSTPINRVFIDADQQQAQHQLYQTFQQLAYNQFAPSLRAPKYNLEPGVDYVALNESAGGIFEHGMVWLLPPEEGVRGFDQYGEGTLYYYPDAQLTNLSQRVYAAIQQPEFLYRFDLDIKTTSFRVEAGLTSNSLKAQLNGTTASTNTQTKTNSQEKTNTQAKTDSQANIQAENQAAGFVSASFADFGIYLAQADKDAVLVADSLILAQQQARTDTSSSISTIETFGQTGQRTHSLSNKRKKTDSKSQDGKTPDSKGTSVANTKAADTTALTDQDTGILGILDGDPNAIAKEEARQAQAREQAIATEGQKARSAMEMLNQLANDAFSAAGQVADSLVTVGKQALGLGDAGSADGTVGGSFASPVAGASIDFSQDPHGYKLLSKKQAYLGFAQEVASAGSSAGSNSASLLTQSAVGSTRFFGIAQGYKLEKFTLVKDVQALINNWFSPKQTSSKVAQAESQPGQVNNAAFAQSLAAPTQQAEVELSSADQTLLNQLEGGHSLNSAAANPFASASEFAQQALKRVQQVSLEAAPLALTADNPGQVLKQLLATNEPVLSGTVRPFVPTGSSQQAVQACTELIMRQGYLGGLKAPAAHLRLLMKSSPKFYFSSLMPAWAYALGETKDHLANPEAQRGQLGIKKETELYQLETLTKYSLATRLREFTSQYEDDHYLINQWVDTCKNLATEIARLQDYRYRSNGVTPEGYGVFEKVSAGAQLLRQLRAEHAEPAENKNALAQGTSHLDADFWQAFQDDYTRQTYLSAEQAATRQRNLEASRATGQGEQSFSLARLSRQAQEEFLFGAPLGYDENVSASSSSYDKTSQLGRLSQTDGANAQATTQTNPGSGGATSVDLFAAPLEAYPSEWGVATPTRVVGAGVSDGIRVPESGTQAAHAYNLYFNHADDELSVEYGLQLQRLADEHRQLKLKQFHFALRQTQAMMDEFFEQLAALDVIYFKQRVLTERGDWPFRYTTSEYNWREMLDLANAEENFQHELGKLAVKLRNQTYSHQTNTLDQTSAQAQNRFSPVSGFAGFADSYGDYIDPYGDVGTGTTEPSWDAASWNNAGWDASGWGSSGWDQEQPARNAHARQASLPAIGEISQLYLSFDSEHTSAMATILGDLYALLANSTSCQDLQNAFALKPAPYSLYMSSYKLIPTQLAPSIYNLAASYRLVDSSTEPRQFNSKLAFAKLLQFKNLGDYSGFGMSGAQEVALEFLKVEEAALSCAPVPPEALSQLNSAAKASWEPDANGFSKQQRSVQVFYRASARRKPPRLRRAEHTILQAHPFVNAAKAYVLAHAPLAIDAFGNARPARHIRQLAKAIYNQLESIELLLGSQLRQEIQLANMQQAEYDLEKYWLTKIQRSEDVPAGIPFHLLDYADKPGELDERLTLLKKEASSLFGKRFGYEKLYEGLSKVREIFRYLASVDTWLDVKSQQYMTIKCDRDPNTRSPVEITLAPFGAEQAFERIRAEMYGTKWVFASATMSVGGDLQRFRDMLGISAYAEADSLPSPFRHYPRAAFYIPSEELVQGINRDCLELIKLNRGRCLWLCTSTLAVQTIYKALSAALKQDERALREQARRELIAQGHQPSTANIEKYVNDVLSFKVLKQSPADSNEKMVQLLRTTNNVVLVATKSFWEGVDVKGEALSLVIIDKFPLPLDDSFYRTVEQIHGVDKKKKDFMLPEAYMNLKQGIGRLIRDETDYGLVVIKDKRLAVGNDGKLGSGCKGRDAHLYKQIGADLMADFQNFRVCRTYQEAASFLHAMTADFVALKAKAKAEAEAKRKQAAAKAKATSQAKAQENFSDSAKTSSTRTSSAKTSSDKADASKATPASAESSVTKSTSPKAKTKSATKQAHQQPTAGDAADGAAEDFSGKSLAQENFAQPLPTLFDAEIEPDHQVGSLTFLHSDYED